MNALLGAVLSATLGTFKQWASNRLMLSEMKAETLARNAREGIPGWSDEFIVVCLYTPLILCFFGPTQGAVKQGFIVMNENIPEPYLWIVGTVTGGVFGFDKLLKFNLKKST